MKYTSYKELAAAFASGELSKDQWVLMVDNDNSRLQYRGGNPHPAQSEAYYDFEDRMYHEGKEMFAGEGDRDILEVLDAAGIPAESV